MKPALLVIDLQKAYYSPASAPSMDRAAARAMRLVGAFRAKKLPLFWVQHLDQGDGSLPGLPGFELIEALGPEEGEARIHKTYNDSFHGTGLAELLRAAGVDTVILAGFCAEYCIIASYWGAKNADLRPFILEGGIASEVEAHIGYVESICSTVSETRLGELLGA